MNDDTAANLPAASNPRARPSWLVLAVALAVAVYGVGYLLWFLATPLGRAPQLDGAENIALARQIAAGTLAREPFYRAMLYPAALAMPLKLGLPADDLPMFAAALGLLCHFLITLGVAKLAGRIWAGPNAGKAALLAAALWGLNPVALFYAVNVLDTVPSLALAVWALVWWSKPGSGTRAVVGGGVLLGLAVAARPHFLPLVFIAPLARAWLGGKWQPQSRDALTWAGAGAVLLALGLVQLYRSGQFAILPTQGAYNFYAANRPGANGKYYAQKMFFTEIVPGENPARLESEALYSRATGKTAQFSMADINAFWRQQAEASITADPVGWLKLEVKKAYYLLNDFEQYNNETYAWHQAASPWLSWNFLGWGVLLVLAASVLPAAWMQAQSREDATLSPRLAGILLVVVVYGVGVLLYYASGRFRLPLLPLMCVLAGGWANWPGIFGSNPKIKIVSSLTTVLAACIAFSNCFHAHDESTFIQDDLLSANAASTVGDDAQAYALAERALALDPTRADARRIAVVSFFNLTLSGDPHYDSLAGWRAELNRMQGMNLSDATLALVVGATLWKTGSPAQAEALWQAGAARFGPDSAPAKALAAAKSLRGEAASSAPPPDASMLEYLKIQPR